MLVFLVDVSRNEMGMDLLRKQLSGFYRDRDVHWFDFKVQVDPSLI